jgi:hypothetical protein
VIHPQLLDCIAVVLLTVLWTLLSYLLGTFDGESKRETDLAALDKQLAYERRRCSLLKSELVDALDQLARAERKRSHMRVIR